MLQYEIEYKSKNKIEEKPQENNEDKHSVEHFKLSRLKRLSSAIRLINFIPPFDEPMSYKPLEIIWKLKKEVLERDPSWVLANNITMLECQILDQIDNIDHTRPWNSDRNKLRYIKLFQTITKLRILHPNWEINLAEGTNFHLCKCLSCMEKKEKLLKHKESASEYSTLEKEGSKKVTTSISEPVLYKNEDSSK